MHADKPLKLADARNHMVVCEWFLHPGSGQSRYLYKDPQGWYILADGKVYLELEDDGETFKGVTVNGA